MPDMESRTQTAYRAFCEVRIGRALTDAEYEALFSRVEFEWIRAAVAAVSTQEHSSA